MTGSYRLREEGGSLHGEMDRLRAQVALSWPREARLLTWMGVPTARAITELGCGPGYVTSRLLDLAPEAHITAVDVDAALVSLARQRLGPMERVTLAVASADSVPVEDASQDAVIARLLLQHLDHPEDVLGEALRILRPGGRMFVIDIDAELHGIAHPRHPHVAPIYGKAARLQAARGGNRRIGRRLWRLLTEAGFEDVQLDSFVYHSDDVGVEAFDPHLNPSRLAPAVEAGLITIHEYAAVQESYRRFRAAPDAYVLLEGLMASGMKGD